MLTKVAWKCILWMNELLKYEVYTGGREKKIYVPRIERMDGKMATTVNINAYVTYRTEG